MRTHPADCRAASARRKHLVAGPGREDSGNRAQNFEAMALGELLKPMFDTVDPSKSAFGGGAAEAHVAADADRRHWQSRWRHVAGLASPNRSSRRCCGHRKHKS